MNASLSLAACNAVTGDNGLESTISVAQSADAGDDKQQQRIDFEPIPMDRLVATAELIVVGSVEDVNESQFAFRTEDVWSRQDLTGVILVEQVVLPEIFAPRITPYMPGQRFVLFLSRSEQPVSDQVWSIVGTPIAGEMRVDDEYAYIDSYDLDGFEYRERLVHGVARNAQRISLNNLKDAVEGYRACFSWNLEERIQNDKVRTRWVVSGNCDEGAVRQYRRQSPIHEYLAESTLRQIPN